jgi:hypothetical protein
MSKQASIGASADQIPNWKGLYSELDEPLDALAPALKSQQLS